MPALREVFARFGIQFDDKQLKKGDKAVSNVAKNLKRLGATLATGLAFRAVHGFITQNITLADKLDKSAAAVGLNTQAWQEWLFIGQLAGVQQEQMVAALGSFQKNVGNAVRGVTEYKKTFEDLGVSLVDSTGQVRDNADIMGDSIAAISRLGSSAEQAAVAQKLMEEVGRRLVPIFAKGEEGVRDLQRQFRELGGGLSRDVIAKSAQAADETAKLELAFTSLKSDILSEVLPGIINFVKGFQDLVKQLREAAEGVSFFRIAAITLVGLGIAVTAAWGGFVVTAILVGAAIAAAVLIVDDLIVGFQGGESVIDKFLHRILGAGLVEGLAGWKIAVEGVKFEWLKLTELPGRFTDALLVSAGQVASWVRSVLTSFRPLLGLLGNLGIDQAQKALAGLEKSGAMARISQARRRVNILRAQRAGDRRAREIEAGVGLTRRQQRGPGPASQLAAGPMRLGSPEIVAAETARREAQNPTIQQLTAPITINAPNADPQAVARAVQERLDQTMREAGAAFSEE